MVEQPPPTSPRERQEIPLIRTLMTDVLVDNSTYFSAMQALDGDALDASILYNLGILLERLVLSERVYVSPTLAWTPGSQDILFGQHQVMHQIRPDEWEHDEAAALFVAAINESLTDVGTRSVWQTLQFEVQHVDSATQALVTWRDLAHDSPREFFQVYSQGVFVTDPASREKIAGLQTGLDAESPKGQHLAQFLLRTNVAFELSTRYTYNPHSHRLLYVDRRNARAQRETLLLGQALLRAAEDELRQAHDRQRAKTILGQFGGFSHKSDIPLVLGAVLEQANSPTELLPAARSTWTTQRSSLQEVASTACRSYRFWRLDHSG